MLVEFLFQLLLALVDASLRKAPSDASEMHHVSAGAAAAVRAVVCAQWSACEWSRSSWTKGSRVNQPEQADASGPCIPLQASDPEAEAVVGRSRLQPDLEGSRPWAWPSQKGKASPGGVPVFITRPRFFF